VRSEIFNASTHCDFALSAYVFMPDHVHLLVQGLSDACELKRFASLAKQRSAFEYSRVRHRRLWQPSYYDHVLRPEESSISILHYMFQNPVREGLAKQWADHPYLGSETMEIDEIVRALKEAGAASWEP